LKADYVKGVGSYSSGRVFDPRIQIIAIIATMTLTIISLDWSLYVILSAYLLIQLTLVRAILAQLRRIVWLMAGTVVFTTLLHLLFGSAHGKEVITIQGIAITEGKLVDGALYSWRVVLLFSVAAWLLAIIERDRLADVVEWLLRPIAALGCSIGGFAMSLRIALRTIPYLQSEHRRIMMAQQARGANFGGSLPTRVRRQSQIIVPLLAATLRRGDRLGDALQARFWRNDITPVNVRSFGISSIDILQVFLTLTLIAAAVVLT
jgi:energy-coupling factor transport system permease protein